MTTLKLNGLYQLKRLPLEERKDGVIYVRENRVFRLLALEGDEAWIKCTVTFKTLIVKSERLIPF